MTAAPLPMKRHRSSLAAGGAHIAFYVVAVRADRNKLGQVRGQKLESTLTIDRMAAIKVLHLGAAGEAKLRV